MNINLQSKTALVCGSTQGIGKAIAQQFAECGASVILCARDENKLKKTQSTLTNPTEHSYIVGDFNNPTELLQKISEYTSKQPIHIVVNNSGGPPGGRLIDASVDEFLHATTRLLYTSHQILQLCVPGMKQAEYGRVINVISTSVRQPIDNLGVSNTVRGATSSWAKTLATELAQFKITVNNILPGATATARLESIIERTMQNTNKTYEQVVTDMQKEIPMKRFAKPEEIAFAATFLASEYAAYITGTNITVDGGRTKSLL